MRRAFLLTATLLAVAAARADSPSLSTLLKSMRVLDRASVIVATPDPHAADMCRGFNLTDSQILDFFRKAQPVPAGVLQQQFRRAACEVEGHLLYRDQKLPFIINAASTGEIELAPGTELHFGCGALCKTIFYYGYPVPAAVSVPPAGTAAAPAAATSPP